MGNRGSGHGVSDAVRGSIRDWMTDRVIEIMLKQSAPINVGNKNIFASRIRDAEEWSRIARKRDLKTGLWKRTYYSKLFGKNGPGLTVLTNAGKSNMPEDMYIEYVTITLGKNVIGGGKVKVPSVKLSQAGRQSKIKDFELQSVFAEFTEKELAKLSAELEFGEDGMLLMLEEERFV